MKVKQYIQTFLILLCMVCASNTAHAEVPTEPVEPLRVREVMPLSFGNFAVDGSAGSVEVDAASGTCRPQGAVMIRSMCERGQFELYGIPGSRVLVQIISETNASHGATIDKVVLFPADGMVTIAANGIAYFYVGGRLSIPRQGKGVGVQANYHVEASYLP